MRIDETHDLVVEAGPYPPGEGPLDYVDCTWGCDDLRRECRSVAVEERDGD